MGEVAHYEAETKKDEARVEAMRADPTKDEYDVKKMLEVVEESRMMIPTRRGAWARPSTSSSPSSRNTTQRRRSSSASRTPRRRRCSRSTTTWSRTNKSTFVLKK